MDSPAATRALTAASISWALSEPSVGSAVPETIGNGSRRFWIVALEADAAEVLTEAEGEDDLGGGRQERDDLHSTGSSP